MHPELVVLYIVAGAFTAALAGSHHADRAELLTGDLYFYVHLFAVAIVSLAGTFSFLAKQRSVGHLPTGAATIRRHEHDFRS